MKRIVSAALVLAVISGCAESAEERAARQEKEANSSLEIDARLAVEAQLRDPASAKFEEVAVYKGADGSKRVCGFVNAANAFGGMAGRRPFVAGNGSAFIGNPENAAEFRLVWSQACQLRQES